MTHYDAVVIGGGTGNSVASAAAERGFETALIEPGPLGGTCLNRGCNPSKMLIHRADVANEIRGAGQFGIDAGIQDVGFESVVREVTSTLAGLAENKEASLREQDGLTLYDEYAQFTGERTLDVGGEEVTGERVVVAAGSRPSTPPIDGLEAVDYLTSTDAVRLEERPDELVVLGGGYIAAELGYFYESMGTAVTMIEMEDSLVPREDADVAETFTEVARRRHDVYTGYRATAVAEEGGRVTLNAESEDGEEIEVAGEELLVALGRRPNTDDLAVEAAGIETNEGGFVETDAYLATTAENVWAMGDIADNYMFKHSGDYEGEIVTENAFGDGQERADWSGMAHAIFTEPEMAATGKTEGELEETGREYVVGREEYTNVAMAKARKIEEGFVKVLADPADGEILGCHIVGPEAPDLIHEVVVALRSGSGTVGDVADAIHVHPALSKVVKYAFENARQSVEG
ncbi:dihydrolipoamide dehydrogenase [Halobacteriales archaeon QS_4_69_34]|nr:MAG: dihydrolipoamide dehydrogenase [Halobacteriales archaeon QS_4_69_34]